MSEIGLTACQIRMARAALRWSVEELARHSGVSEKTIRRIEKVYGFPANVTLDVMNKLAQCFEEQGMTFMPEDGSVEGPGVRFGKYPGRVVSARSVESVLQIADGGMQRTDGGLNGRSEPRSNARLDAS